MKTFRNRCKVETSSVRKMKTVFSDNSLIIIALYVDDLIIAGTTTDVNQVKHFLNSRYVIKDLGQVHHILGCKVIRD